MCVLWEPCPGRLCLVWERGGIFLCVCKQYPFSLVSKGGDVTPLFSHPSPLAYFQLAPTASSRLLPALRPCREAAPG